MMETRHCRWPAGRLIAFSALDGPTDYRNGLVLRTVRTPAGIEVVLPARAIIRFEHAPADDVMCEGGAFAYRTADSNTDFRTLTQELRLAGRTEKLDWLIGGYYANEKLQVADNLSYGSDYDRYANCLVADNFALLTGQAGLLTPGSATCFNKTIASALLPAVGANAPALAAFAGVPIIIPGIGLVNFGAPPFGNNGFTNAALFLGVPGQHLLLGRAHGGDHVRAAERGELRGQQPDTTGGRVQQHVVTGLQRHGRHREVVRRDALHRQGCRGLVGHARRHDDRVGGLDHRQLRVRAGGRRPRHPLPDGDVAHLGAHGDDLAGALRAHDVRELHAVHARAPVGVDEVHARGGHPHHDLARSGLRIGQLDELEDFGTTGTLGDNGTHGNVVPRATRKGDHRVVRIAMYCGV